MSERMPSSNHLSADASGTPQSSIQQQLPPKSGTAARGDSRSTPVLFVESLRLEDLLERAELDLEAAFWPSVYTYTGRALALDPGNARAYLYRLMADLKITGTDQLKNQKRPFDSQPNYQTIMRLGDESIKNLLRESNQYVCDHLNDLYQSELDEVRHTLAYAKVVSDVNQAESLLEHIPQFPASDRLREECSLKKQELFPCTLEQAERCADEDRWAEAVSLLESISYDEKCRVKLLEYRQCLEKDNRYLQGVAFHRNNQFREAAEIFATLGNYRDSTVRLRQCNRMIKGKKVRAVGKEHIKAVWVNTLLAAFMALGCTVSAPSHILLNLLWGIPLMIFSVVMTIVRSRYRPAKRMWIVMAAVFGLFLLLTALGILPFGPGTTALPSVIYLTLMLCSIFI